MGTRNPVTCEKCHKGEGYYGCPQCRNHLCSSCCKTKKTRDGDEKVCPNCGTGMYANAGDRW